MTPYSAFCVSESMKLWWKRHSGVLAVVFATTTALLVVVVGYQALMLHDRGWRWDLGTVPAWLSGIGAFATFGALWVATQQWKLGQADRRLADEERRALAAAREGENHDQHIRQARLVIVEQFDLLLGVGRPNPNRHVVIRNHSNDPVFNLHIDPTSPKNRYILMEELTSAPDSSGILADHDRHYRHSAPDIPVLSPGLATYVIYPSGGIPRDEPATEYVGFSYTDVRGARWHRLGSEQPVQILDTGDRSSPTT